MAEIKDQIGRIGKFQDAAIEKLSSMLTAAVGKAVKYASEQVRASASISDKDYEKLSKALEDLGDDLKENLKATKKFVDDVKDAAKSFDNTKQSHRAAGSEAKGSLEGLQREQTKILGMILENQKKAQSAKLAKYTSGGSSIGAKGKISLGDMGFRPKGTDKIPAMLSPGEFIVNRKGASRNSGILDKINRGYSLGGLVKPKYLQHGSETYYVGANMAPGATGARPIGGGAEVVVEKVTLDSAAAVEAEKIGNQLQEHITKGFKENSNKEIASWLTGFSTALLGGKGDLLQTLFTGSVTDAMDFQREMRLIAFQTKGITGDLRGMQGEFANLGKSVSAETGKSVSALQRVYMSNLKKGFKNNEDGLKVMKSGLFLSTMIGSETQQTADLFGDWHRTLALTSGQMGEMARNMRDVALSTGVTGDELIGAMKSSEGILKNLRNQGNLTADVSKTVIEMMAEAKKAGFEDSTGKYLTAMSSYGSMKNADSSTKSLLYSVANQMGPNASRQMMMGTFMNDRSNMAGFSKGLKNRVASMIGQTGENFDFNKLTSGERDLLAIRLQSIGIEIGEAENLIKTSEKASKGLAGTLEDLDKIAKNPFATEAEKKLAEKQKNQKILNNSLNYLSALSDEAKDKSLSDALKESATSDKFKDKRQDFTALGGYLTSEMKSMYGIGGTDEQMKAQLANMDPSKAAELHGMIVGDQLEKMAKEQGVSLEKNYKNEIANAIANGQGDTAGFRDLVAEANKKASEISVQEQASTSPEEELVLSLNKLNETIRGYTSSFVRNIVDLIGAMGLLGANVAIMSVSLYKLFGDKLLNFAGVMDSLFPEGGFKGLFSRFSSVDDLASTIKSSDKVSEGLFKNFFKTYSDSRKGSSGLGWKKEGKNVLGSVLDATDELGDLMKGKIVGSVEQVGEKGFKFFNVLSDGITNASSTFMKGFSRSKAAGGGFFKSLARGFSGLGKSNNMTRGLTKSIEGLHSIFFKGFSRSRAAGGGVFKSLIRGFSGLAKSNKTARSLMGTLTKGLTKVKSMGLDAFGFVRKNVGFVDAFAKGFSRARMAGQGLIGSLMRGFSGARKSIGVVRNIKQGFFSAFNFLTEGNLMAKIYKGFSGVKKIFSGGFAGLLKGVGAGFRGGMRAAAGGLRAALIGGTAGTAQIIFSAIDMVFGAVSGFTNTGKNFEGVMKAMGKSTKDLTWGMYAASTVSGGLVGILDGLTFGLLRMSGAAAWLEQVLSLVLYGVFSFIEGIVEGFMGAFKMVTSAFSYLGEQFASIGNALLSVFNSIAGIFGGEAKNLSEAFAMMYPIIKKIGTAIGFIFGGPISAAIWVVVKAFSAVVAVIEILANVISGVVGFISNFIKVLVSLVTLDFKGVWKGFKGMGLALFRGVAGMFTPILKWLGSIGKDFLAPFKWLFETVLGKGVMDGMASFFKGIPKGIYNWIYGAAGAIPGGQWLMDALFGKKETPATKTTTDNAAKNASATSTTGNANAALASGQAAETRGRNFEQQVTEIYGEPTARKATTYAGNSPSATDVVANRASYSMERASAAVSTPVGQHAIPTARPNQDEDIGSVQPVHLRDITGSILRDKAGTSGTGRIQSDELSRIEEASFRQVDELEQIRQGISEMVALLRPKGSGVVGGAGDQDQASTRDPRRPLHAARFGKMKYGKVGGNANRSLVNNGES